MMEVVCRTNSTVDNIFEVLFYVVWFNFSFYLPKLYYTDSLIAKIRRWFTQIWNSHGPSITLCLLLCTEENWWKYLGGIITMICIYSFGTDCLEVAGKWDARSLFVLFTISLHHNGAIVAWYYQQPNECWLNAMFFGHVWFIHSHDYYEKGVKYIMSFFTSYVLPDGSFMKVYASFTVIFYAIYAYFMHIGMNYVSVAVFFMMFGRFFANFNITHHLWMRDIEAPGMIFITLVKTVGWISAILVTGLYLYFKKYLIGPVFGDNLAKPKRFVMNDKVRRFIHEFPPGDKPDADKTKASMKWFDSNFKDGWKLFRAICISDEQAVKELLEKGEDPNQKCTSWYNSTPIQWCAGGGHINCTIPLIEAGVNPFEDGVAKSARMFGQEHYIDFLNQLKPLVFEALREEYPISCERQPEPGLTWDTSKKLAEAKGGRLCTAKEALEYIMKAPIFGGEDQWCAVLGKDGAREWIQVGDSHHQPGTLHLAQYGETTWGNDLTDTTHGEVTWNRILLWKVPPKKISDLTNK